MSRMFVLLACLTVAAAHPDAARFFENAASPVQYAARATRLPVSPCLSHVHVYPMSMFTYLSPHVSFRSKTKNQRNQRVVREHVKKTLVLGAWSWPLNPPPPHSRYRGENCHLQNFHNCCILIILYCNFNCLTENGLKDFLTEYSDYFNFLFNIEFLSGHVHS